MKQTKRQDEVLGRNIRVRILYCVFAYIVYIALLQIKFIFNMSAYGIDLKKTN